jgi:hypothetical protein
MKRNKILPWVVRRTRRRVANAYAHTNAHPYARRVRGRCDNDGDNETAIRRLVGWGKLSAPTTAAHAPNLPTPRAGAIFCEALSKTHFTINHGHL